MTVMASSALGLGKPPFGGGGGCMDGNSRRHCQLDYPLPSRGTNPHSHPHPVSPLPILFDFLTPSPGTQKTVQRSLFIAIKA